MNFAPGLLGLTLVAWAKIAVVDEQLIETMENHLDSGFADPWMHPIVRTRLSGRRACDVCVFGGYAHPSYIERAKDRWEVAT